MLPRGAPPVTSFACAVELIREDDFGVDAVRSGGPPRRYCRKGRRVIGLVYMETTAWRLSRPAPPRPRSRNPFAVVPATAPATSRITRSPDPQAISAPARSYGHS